MDLSFRQSDYTAQTIFVDLKNAAYDNVDTICQKVTMTEHNFKPTKLYWRYDLDLKKALRAQGATTSLHRCKCCHHHFFITLCITWIVAFTVYSPSATFAGPHVAGEDGLLAGRETLAQQFGSFG